MNLVVADATLGNDSALATALFDLLKNTRELEYMAHQFHWNIVGVKFNTMHEFYEEEYKQLFEDQDEIAEQIRQQGFFVPAINNVVLEENYSASGFEEQLINYSGKLSQNMALIDKVNDLANNEIAVQDLCARLRGLRGLSLNLKVRAMLGGNKMSLEPSEATAATMYKVEFKDIHSNREEEKFINLKDANARYKELKSRCGKGGDIEWVEKPVKYTTNQTYKSNVKVDSKSANEIKEALKKPGIMREDDTTRFTAKFANGYEMDIKCCGANDETAWTEAILYDDKGNEVRVSDVDDEYFKEWEIEDDNGNKYIAKVTATASAVTAGKLDIAKIDKFLSNLAKKYKVATIEKGRDFGTNPTTSFDWHLYKYSRIKPSGMDNTKMDVIYNAGDITISAHKGDTGNGNIKQKAKIHSVKTLERYAEEFAKWAFSDNNSAVTAGFDKGRYKEIDEESKFFKVLKDDCNIRAKNFYAINKGLRLAIKVIKGTFEDASIRFFALKNKGGYVRVELKDKVYIVGYTIYESGKIKVWTRELKSNVPVNSFDYDMLNMYAKPFGTKMVTGMLPTWMSI